MYNTLERLNTPPPRESWNFHTDRNLLSYLNMRDIPWEGGHGGQEGRWGRVAGGGCSILDDRPFVDLCGDPRCNNLIENRGKERDKYFVHMLKSKTSLFLDTSHLVDLKGLEEFVNVF